MYIGIGCSKDSKPNYNEAPYTTETAIKNGDVVVVHGKQYNVKRLEKFMENIKNNKNDKVRITAYTIEGGAIVTDLEYDGKKINYIYDSTRDTLGEQKIDKKEFNGDSIYKSGSEYYLKNTPNNILIYWK